MRIQKFIISFDNANAVYRQGESVSGKVFLSLEKTLKLKGIRLQIVGETVVRWEYGRKKAPKPNSNHIFASHEEYFNFKQTLHGRDEEDKKSKNVELGRGQYEFPFSYTMPSDISLPTSLEGPYGYVRYFARAVIDRPVTKNCYTIKPFTVLGVLDLNLDEISLMPSTNSKQHSITSCICCKSGNRVISIGLNRTGYCPGEVIKISATCENSTSNKILRSSADLLQIVDYVGTHKLVFGKQTKTRRTMKTIQSVRGEGCASHSSLIWECMPLTVPAIPPSKLEGSSFIDIKYVIRFTIYMKKNRSAFVETPVLIGTEPLRSMYPMYHEGMQPIASPPLRMSVDTEPTAPPENNLPPYDCPPPSYEACVYGGATLTDDEFTMGQTTFVPMYQVYNTLRSQTRSTAMSNRCSLADPVVLVAANQPESAPVDESVLDSTVVEMSYAEGRFNPNDERYIYSTPNPHGKPEEDQQQRSRGNSQLRQSSVDASPIGVHPMFRPSSSSPPHSPQHEEEVSDADNLEAELRHQRGNSHVIVTSPNRESTSDCESSGLPEDAMIPLSDDEREHPPPAPQHTGKYHNDYVAVENEIYMAYGQDQHHDSSAEASPDSHNEDSHGGRQSFYSAQHTTAAVPHQQPVLLPRNSSQEYSYHEKNTANQYYSSYNDGEVAPIISRSSSHSQQAKEVYQVQRQTSRTKVTAAGYMTGGSGDAAILMADADGSSFMGSDLNSDDQEMYMDETNT